DLACHMAGACFVDIRDHDARAFGGQPAAIARADAAPTARDNGDLPIEDSHAIQGTPASPREDRTITTRPPWRPPGSPAAWPTVVPHSARSRTRSGGTPRAGRAASTAWRPP